MENSSMPSDVIDFTTSSSQDDAMKLFLAHVRDLTLKYVYVIIGTVGVLDNLFVIITFALFIKITDKTMNILMVYQSVIDMFASFFMLLTAVVEVKATDMSRKSVHDQFVCHIWLTRQQLWYFMTASTYGILLMAYDRYAAVIYPVWYNGKLNVRRRLVYVAIVIMCNVLPAYLTAVGSLTTYIDGGFCLPWSVYSSYAMEIAVISSSLLVMYLLPLTVMAFCYTRIIYALRYKVASGGTSTVNTVGRNAVITYLMVCCGFVLCFTPMAILHIIGLFIRNIQYGTWYFDLATTVMHANSIINPFIYAAKYCEFKRGVRRLLSKMKLTKQLPSSLAPKT